MHRVTCRVLSVSVVMAFAGCAEPEETDLFGSASETSGGTGIGSGNDASASATSGGSADGGSSGSVDTGADGPGIKLDVGPSGDLTGGCVGEGCTGCTYVDLLFVIDNSGSMGGYQQALGLAFPAFADTLVNTLPPGTNVHVGVTSTEMAYSSQGSTSINNGECEFIGDNNQTNDAFYVTPDQMDTGRNGAQGRLYDPGGGQTYYEFDTNAGAQAIQGLADWFSSAANIGTGGSNIEMSTAPVGWVADSANDTTNAGFIRDAGAVLVVFFMQDEPDQTPMMIDGQPGGQAMLDRIVQAKTQCGGTQCMIAGGFLAANACNAQGNLPLDDFLAGVGNNPVVSPLPPDGNPQAAADEMNETLSTTLAEVIVQTCENIPPAG